MRAIVVLVVALGFANALPAETRIVSTTSRGQTTTQSTLHLEEREGDFLRVVEENEEGRVVSLLAADGTVASASVRTEDGEILMTSDGVAVLVEGLWKGKPVSGRYELGGLGFYGSGFTFALRALATRELQSLRFPVIDPRKPSSAMILELRREGVDEYKGRRAIKARISMSGVMSALWGGRMLIGDDGTFLRYEGSRGPGTAKMVSELVDVRE